MKLEVEVKQFDNGSFFLSMKISKEEKGFDIIISKEQADVVIDELGLRRTKKHNYSQDSLILYK